MSQLHADLVMLLVGATVGLYVAARVVSAAPLARAALVLLGVELAQGALGFAQYFTGLPVVLVGLHLAGACAVLVAAVHVVLATRERVAATDGAAAARPPVHTAPPTLART